MTNKTHSSTLTHSSLLALATGLACTATPAKAQVNDGSFQADGFVVEGQAQIIRDPNITDVIVETEGVVIDWIPDDDFGQGDIDFQPFGTIATFRDDGIVTDFAVLNRILPTDLSRRVVFNGTVVSEIQGQVGGTVFFYSPGGILVGSDAVFDVGNLGLTTAEPITDGFGNFIFGDTVDFAPSLPSSEISVDVGAQIFADQNPGSYVALFAPRIINRGGIFVDGQAALVGAEAGTITFSPDGLFDIQVDVGSEFAQPIENTGVIGGAASVDGSSRVYMVAISKNSAATIAIRGGSSLGFDVANSAFMDGDTVVLSAGFNVTAGEIDATELSDGFIDITSEDSGFGPGVAFTSSVIGKAASDVALNARDSLGFAGDAKFSGRQVLFDLDTDFGTGSVGNLTVGGDLTLLADHARIGADVGTAHFRLFNGTTADIGGNLRVGSIGTVDGDGNGIVQTGNAQVFVTGAGSLLTVGGNVISEASVDLANDFSGATAQPFLAEVRAEDQGAINVTGVTRVLNQAIAGEGGGANSGTADLFVQTGGTITTGEANVASRAVGGDGNGMGVQAGSATSGIARLRSEGMGSSITVTNANTIGDGALGELDFIASEAIGGIGVTGAGGAASTANVELNANTGGSLNLANDPFNPLLLVNRAVGGDTSANDSAGGEAGVADTNIQISDGIQNLGRISILSEGTGGSAVGGAERTRGGDVFGPAGRINFTNTDVSVAFGEIRFEDTGGDGSGEGVNGEGGNVSTNFYDITFQNSTVNILSDLTIISNIRGGDGTFGGDANGQPINPFMPSGTLSVAGDIVLDFTSTGGNATGTLADEQAGTPINGGTANGGAPGIRFHGINANIGGDILLSSVARGGGSQFGAGGLAVNPSATFEVFSGSDVTAQNISLFANAIGGSGNSNGGQGQNSFASMSISDGSLTTNGGISIGTSSTGGDSTTGNGGDANSIPVSLNVDGLTGSLNVLGTNPNQPNFLFSEAFGGTGGGGNGGNAQAGSISFGVTNGATADLPNNPGSPLISARWP